MAYYPPMGGSGGAGGQSNLPSRLYPPVAQPVRSVGMQDGPAGGPGGFYPQVAQPVPIQSLRAPPPPSVPSGGGVGIRVRIKPEYRMAPSVELSPLDGDIPRSTFHFDFALERQVLAGDGDHSPDFPPSASPTASVQLGMERDHKGLDGMGPGPEAMDHLGIRLDELDVIDGMRRDRFGQNGSGQGSEGDGIVWEHIGWDWNQIRITVTTSGCIRIGS
ncbi:hypothetical protein CBR_g84869 [Chara braunii]|uniref:Uncharacterized protein n=1 Tax=Chara braunii TaxID=69332 RepID=A0A388KB31_CHABU|nr:hypothetical protein CBR_g84869 [Chara braunii]|eukprot:GBG67206.1 hypothetical protein CBR_g84869 [Chara braunii]